MSALTWGRLAKTQGILGLVIGVALHGSVSLAEPGPVVSYLMTTPTSAFSFGMYRLDQALKETDLSDDFNYWSTYDWDKNRIVVSASSWEGSTEPTQEECRNALNDIRVRGGVNAYTGLPFLEQGSLFASFFMPVGYEIKRAPENLRAKLDQIILIAVSIERPDGNVRCEGALVSKEILFRAAE